MKIENADNNGVYFAIHHCNSLSSQEQQSSRRPAIQYIFVLRYPGITLTLVEIVFYFLYILQNFEGAFVDSMHRVNNNYYLVYQ